MKITLSTLFVVLFLLLASASGARAGLNIDVQLGAPYYYAPPPVVHYYAEEPVVVYHRHHHRPRAYYHEAPEYYRYRSYPDRRYYHDRYAD